MKARGIDASAVLTQGIRRRFPRDTLLLLHQKRMQHFGRQAVQGQTETGTQRRHRDQRMPIVDQHQMLARIRQRGDANADGFVELQRFAVRQTTRNRMRPAMTRHPANVSKDAS